MLAAAAALKGAVAVGRWLAPGLALVGRWLAGGAHAGLRFALPLYHAYREVKRVVMRFYAPLEMRHRLLHPFSRRFLQHVTVVVVAVVVAAANLNATAAADDEIAQTRMINALVGEGEIELLTETGPLPPSGPTVTSYLNAGAVAPAGQLAGEALLAQLEPGTHASGALVKPILSPGELATRQRNEVVRYTVEGGETVTAIAAKFGISINTILWENKLTAYTIIRPGQTLTILPVSGIRHRVAKGDTVAKIAKRYTGDPASILELNDLDEDGGLAVGTWVIIPGGRRPIDPPSYAVRSLRAPPSASAALGGAYAWPAGCRRITQYFTWRHSGLDIACPSGTAIYATADGTVIRAQGGWNGGYGLMVVVDHGNGLHSLYGHNSRLYVQVGDRVQKGQAIAGIGSTGRSTGPHVHFEIRQGGVRKNPLSYIR